MMMAAALLWENLSQQIHIICRLSKYGMGSIVRQTMIDGKQLVKKYCKDLYFISDNMDAKCIENSRVTVSVTVLLLLVSPELLMILESGQTEQSDTAQCSI